MLFDRSSAVYVGNLGPVPLYVHPSALVLVLLAMMWAPNLGGITGVLLLLAVLVKAIVLHEMGHGMAARALGAQGVTITLWAMGGLCSSYRDNQRPIPEMIILAAGPAVSFALWGISLGIMYYLRAEYPQWMYEADGEWSLLHIFLWINGTLNMWLGIFNSLPIYPLDGGQFLYQLLTLLRVPRLTVHQLCFYLALIFVVLVLAWRVYGLHEDNTAGFFYTTILLGFLLYNAHAYLMQR